MKLSEEEIKRTTLLVAEEDDEIIGFANFIYGEELYLAANETTIST